MVAPCPLSQSANLAFKKGADALVVTGDASGDAPTLKQLRDAAGTDLPVLIGSGLQPGNAETLLAECDGAIVGTSLMQDKAVNADALELLMSGIAR